MITSQIFYLLVNEYVCYTCNEFESIFVYEQYICLQ